jgi:hypothetical protein
MQTLLERHLTGCAALASAAAGLAAAQQSAADTLQRALDLSDAAAARDAVDEMGAAFRAFYASLQNAERAWNDLAPAVVGD